MQISPNLHFQVIWPQMTWPLTFICYFWLHEHMEVSMSYKPNLVKIGLLTFQMKQFLHFQPVLQLNLRWPLTLVYDIWLREHMKVPISIDQVWFNVNFSNGAIFTFLVYLTTWPQMTFDLDMWPLTSSTNEGSHVASMTQLWLKSIKACES